MDLSVNLPAEIGMDILSRVPIESLRQCRFVRRSWADLVERLPMREREPSVAVFPMVAYYEPGISYPPPPPSYQILETGGAAPCRVLLNPPPPDYMPPATSSAKGLILLDNHKLSKLMVCNPITREYLGLPPYPTPTPHNPNPGEQGRLIMLGFGVSRLNEQYKVVRITEDEEECHVYTVGGAGEWRSVPCPALVFQWENRECAFVGGNLHWLLAGGTAVCCFDVDMEVFSVFPAPPSASGRSRSRKLHALEGRLCLVEDFGHKTVFWLMMGEEWIEHFVIASPALVPGCYFPIKVVEGGHAIWLGDCRLSCLVYYSDLTKTFELSSEFHPSFMPAALVFTPSFRSLTSIRGEEVEDVRSF